MRQHEYSAGGKAPIVVSARVVALFDPATGDIVHAHAVTTCEGAIPLSEDEAVEAAKAHATRAGHAVSSLRVKVSTDLRHALRPHRIDPATGEFKSV